MDKQLEKIRQAYDLTVAQYNKGINPFDALPEEFKNSPEFKAFINNPNPSYSSGAPENKKYLNPQPGMRFLDVGCSANLANHRLDKWSSTYYGVDISPALIKAMQNFVNRENITLGGLHVVDIANLPFEDKSFDIAAVIGVLEYCNLGYIKKALQELHRVLKPEAKIVLDIPNQKHPHYPVMLKVEEYLKRPIIVYSRSAFEELLTPLFSIERTDNSHVMLKYFLQSLP